MNPPCQAWEVLFRAHVADLPQTLSQNPNYAEASNRLRNLVRSGILKHSDVHDAPEKFFAAHRILSEYATKLGPGFGIRFTVQFNLFAGTITAIGTSDHLQLLKDMQSKGQLGCFALTEKLAGVNSGLVVETTCTWDPASHTFELHTPYPGAAKNWISQGCVAEYGVVMANLVLSGKSFGPHAFVMQLRDPSTSLMTPGVNIMDMGAKTIGNDLDNAAIVFNRVRLPKSALLNRFADIDETGRYMQLVKGVANIDMIGQRLYTGRIVIAESAVVFTRTLFETTRQYSDAKPCWAPNMQRPTLSQIPQLKALFFEADQRLHQLQKLLDRLQDQFTPHLRKGGIPPKELVDVVAAAKISCIESGIELCHRLKQEVGSFALMAGSGFERTDYLQCCKFAEGDSRILMQKLARDRVSSWSNLSKSSGAERNDNVSEEEGQLCSSLSQALKGGGPKAWDEQWENVYKLANLVVRRLIRDFLLNDEEKKLEFFSSRL
ncbi:hypothetical protein CEUSTIGMA_g6962.t1 [Chlamydomonas eustigma]|uniref:Acyl-coenzyme A oxidase n=1 Tax=Chlamydomonas eustigma TaxID=1157962 RepID=A0A250X8X1_9CHLO|nr:hypothetical protein CEUSTIGMA_g6962.t1 [Chlamydomonas eustigma]|eukprot:GAX79521.1 hypothetical protein CEUSTIGMA_g6962.t1 [Chlamydomonas eustigma]